MLNVYCRKWSSMKEWKSDLFGLLDGYGWIPIVVMTFIQHVNVFWSKYFICHYTSLHVEWGTRLHWKGNLP